MMMGEQQGAVAGLSPRGVRVARQLADGDDDDGRVPVQIDFERRLGPLAIACRHWRRRLAARCVRQWYRAAAAAVDDRPRAAWQPQHLSAHTRRHSEVTLRPWWTRWRGWHAGRLERRDRIWVALRVSRCLRVALTEWATAAATSVAAGGRRERHFAVRYWFARWSLCAERSAAPFVRVEYRRIRSVAAQWLRQARRLAVVTRWRTQVAVREGSKHLRRRVLLRWYEAAHYANRAQLVVAAVHRDAALAAQCWMHWYRRASGVSAMTAVLSAWRDLALRARATQHWLGRRLLHTFRYWASVWVPAAREKAAERVRIDIFVLAYSTARRAREDIRAMRTVVGGWLRHCNDQLAKRTACALADQCFRQNLWQRLRTNSFIAWRCWTDRQICTALCATAADELCRAWLLRRFLVRWRRQYVSATTRKRRIAVRKLAISHYKRKLLHVAVQAWQGWLRAVFRLIQEAMGLADNHSRQRTIVCSFRRWSRRARRTASIRNELVRLHLRKVRTRRAFDGLRRAADGLYGLRVLPHEPATPTRRAHRQPAGTNIGSAGACTSPCVSPGAGMHGIMPPSTPRTQRKLLSPSNANSSGDSDKSHMPSPPASKLFLHAIEEPTRAVGTDAVSTPWAKHVANLMSQFETGDDVARPAIGSGMASLRAQTSELPRAEFVSAKAEETSFDYVSVSSVSSASSASDEEVEPKSLITGTLSTLPASENGSDRQRVHARDRCVVPLTTGRLANLMPELTDSGQRSLRRVDTNTAAQSAPPTQPKHSCKEAGQGDMLGDQQPSNHVLTVAVLSAVQAGATAWRARYLQRAMMRRWAVHTSNQVEIIARVAQALSMATFHRLGAALNHWRRACAERPRSVSQPQEDHSVTATERRRADSTLSREAGWNLEDSDVVARAIRTLSNEESWYGSDNCSTPPVLEKTTSPAATPDTFDVEKAMAAIRASQNSRAEAAKLLEQRNPYRSYGELGSLCVPDS